MDYQPRTSTSSFTQLLSSEVSNIIIIMIQLYVHSNLVSNLVFYAQSTSTVISGRLRPQKQAKKP